MKSALWFTLLLISIADDTLLLSVNFFRPGASFPHNNVGNKTSWIDLLGSLDSVGIRMEYELGFIMGQRYIQTKKTLSTTYDPRQLIIYSDDYNDSINSAYSFLLGLYGPHSYPKFDTTVALDSINLMPPLDDNSTDSLKKLSLTLGTDVMPQSQTLIPVHVLDKDHDYMLDPLNSCPFVFNLLDEYTSSNGKNLSNLVTASNDLINTLSSAFAVKANYINAAEVYKMYDFAISALFYQADIGFNINSLSQGAKDNLTKIISAYTYTYFPLQDTHYNISNFTVAPILSNLSALFANVITNANASSHKSFVGYFIHDSLLLPLINVLTAQYGLVLPYGSFFTINLYLDINNSPYLTMGVNDVMQNNMTLDSFNAISNKMQVNAWNDYCFGPPMGKTAGVVAIVIECVLLVVVIINWVFILKGKNGTGTDRLLGVESQS